MASLNSLMDATCNPRLLRTSVVAIAMVRSVGLREAARAARMMSCTTMMELSDVNGSSIVYPRVPYESHGGKNQLLPKNVFLSVNGDSLTFMKQLYLKDSCSERPPPSHSVKIRNYTLKERIRGNVLRIDALQLCSIGFVISGPCYRASRRRFSHRKSLEED